MFSFWGVIRLDIPLVKKNLLYDTDTADFFMTFAYSLSEFCSTIFQLLDECSNDEGFFLQDKRPRITQTKAKNCMRRSELCII